MSRDLSLDTSQNGREMHMFQIYAVHEQAFQLAEILTLEEAFVDVQGCKGCAAEWDCQSFLLWRCVYADRGKELILGSLILDLPASKNQGEELLIHIC